MDEHNDTAAPTAASVAAYTEHADDYAAFNADLMASAVTEFSQALPGSGTVLDAGCGPGRDLARFAALGRSAVGVDANETFAAMAAGTGCPVTIADLRSLPFVACTFAGIWACASLVHLDEAGAAAAARELRRVSSAGAPIRVSVKSGDPARSGWVETRHGRRWFRYWTPAQFTDLLSAAGWQVTSSVDDGVFVEVSAYAR